MSIDVSDCLGQEIYSWPINSIEAFTGLCICF